MINRIFFLFQIIYVYLIVFIILFLIKYKLFFEYQFNLAIFFYYKNFNLEWYGVLYYLRNWAENMHNSMWYNTIWFNDFMKFYKYIFKIKNRSVIVIII